MQPLRGSRGGRAAALAALLGSLACASPRGPFPTELSPVEHRRPARPPLPDDSEKAAARVALLALADRPDSAAASLQDLQEIGDRRRAAGQAPTGLLDNALDVVRAMDGPDAYRTHAERMLRRDPDPLLRRRLEAVLAEDPLREAELRLREHRRARIAAVFNRISAPLGLFAAGGELNPIATGRAAIGTLLVLYGMPDTSPQERQALHAYRRYLRRHPEGGGSARIAERVEHYDERRLRALHAEALEIAEQALTAGRPDVCLAHLDRADRLIPEDPRSFELRSEARARLARHDANVRTALTASFVFGVPLDRETRRDLRGLLVALFTTDGEELASYAREAREGRGRGPIGDELRFIEVIGSLDRWNETAFFEGIERLSRVESEESNMTRHARWTLVDPEQNPYRHYRAAVAADRKDRALYLLLGRFRRGPTRRELPRPVEWLLDLPGVAVTIATLPVRLLQYPGTRRRFGSGVLETGERYLGRFPEGAHARSVRRDLEGRYRTRGRWSRALEHHRARGDPDPRVVQRYRDRIAEQALESARLERRWDVRAQIYRWIQTEHAASPSAEVATRELGDLLRGVTPQRIRLSKGFLEENPELWAPGALGLRAELMDGDDDNGELGEEGVTLIGQTHVRLALVGRDPVVQSIDGARFARLVSLVEEIYYRRIATDDRERAEHDPQRDLFFERARLGLLATPDLRPTAMSEATFLSLREKHGLRRPESLLPVELVVSGDLEDFGLAAYPRIRPPRETEDAWLYR